MEWLTALFMVGFSFCGRYFLSWSFSIWYEVTINCLLQFDRHYFTCIARVKLVKNLPFQIILLWKNCQKYPTMPALDRNVKVTCGYCGTSVTKKHLSRHKLSCSGGTSFCPKCPNFSTKSRHDLNYLIAKKHSVSRPSTTYKCTLCHAEFPGFYALRQHKNLQQGTQIGLGAGNIDVEDIVGDDDHQSLREEMESCKHFLTDTEMENGRHRFFNFALSVFDISLLNDKLDYVFKELKYAAKVNLAFGFVLKSIEDGMCRYFYAHENNTIMERAELVRTQADMSNLKDRVQKNDIVDNGTRERTNTKRKFYKLTNLTIFTSLLKDVRMGC